MATIKYEPVIGLEIHAELLTQFKNVLQLLGGLLCDLRAEYPDLSGVHGSTRRDAGGQREGG